MPKFKLIQNQVDRLNLVSREILTGLSVIRAFGTQKHEEERFDDANKALTKTNLFVNRAMTFMMPLMMFVMNSITLLIVWVGGHSINDGVMQVGDMMAFIQYTMQIIMAFLMICMISVMLPRAAVSASRIDEVLTSETMIHDPKQPSRIPEEGKGKVVFDHVSFRYPGAEEDVLHDISFTAKAGQKTALVGESGSGKSTLAKLLIHYYDPQKGSISIGGQKLCDMSLEALNSRISYVAQDQYLFNTSLLENIRLGRLTATDEEVIEAAKKAQCMEFIEKLPQGIHSMAGDAGKMLSGGQRQRISLARAILKDAPIVVLDEATAYADPENEEKMEAAIAELVKGKTLVVIAHKLPAIMNADQICVIDHGKLVAAGKHQDLIRSCPEYQKLLKAAQDLSLIHI